MPGLMIADSQNESRQLLLKIFLHSGFEVVVATSAASALSNVFNRSVKVVLLGSYIEGLSSAALVPLLRECNPEVVIILVSEPLPLAQLREVRRAGIFYHALPPRSAADKEELLQAVFCALSERNRSLLLPKPRPGWCRADQAL
ncbi:response regulator [Desulfuromonas carbonis]